MNNKVIFYRCNHCGNLVLVLKDGGVNPICCGEKMEKLVSNSIDASLEKHVPVVMLNENILTVNIGSVPHPMLEEHKIEFICLITESGYYIKKLVVGNEPKAIFTIDEKPLEVYAYCNLHGLWKTEIN